MAFSDAISDGDSLGRLDTTCSCGWLSRGTRAQGVAVIYRGIMRMQRIYRELARKTVSDMTWLGISGGGLNGIIWNIHPNQKTVCCRYWSAVSVTRTALRKFEEIFRAGSATAADKQPNTDVDFSTDAGNGDWTSGGGEEEGTTTVVVAAHLGNDKRSILTQKTSFLLRSTLLPSTIECSRRLLPSQRLLLLFLFFVLLFTQHNHWIA